MGRTIGSDAVTFSGFGKGSVGFFDDLARNNNRQWWHASKHRYETEIRAPLEQLLADLAGEFGEAHVFRPNRDTRFSKDKSPYKPNAAAVIHIPPAGGVYVSLGAEGLFVGGGGYRMARDQLARFRAAIDDDASGKQLEKVVADLRKKKATVGGHAELKTAPRGYNADHPRIELLRLDGISGGWTHPPKAWLYTAQAASKVAEAWRAVAPLNAWVAKHVGASSMSYR
jgi:uncharacterized protein (TIGR02453 family)